MQLWQMDVMGRIHLADGLEVKVITGIDDHSQFIVSAKAVVRATARPVCHALHRHGIPEQISTTMARSSPRGSAAARDR